MQRSQDVLASRYGDTLGSVGGDKLAFGVDTFVLHQCLPTMKWRSCPASAVPAVAEIQQHLHAFRAWGRAARAALASSLLTPCKPSLSRLQDISAEARVGGISIQGVDVVVAAPGRAREHLAAGTLRLDACAAVVLDEADLLLSAQPLLSVQPQTLKHVRFCSRHRGPLVCDACAAVVLDEADLLLSAQPLLSVQPQTLKHLRFCSRHRPPVCDACAAVVLDEAGLLLSARTPEPWTNCAAASNIHPWSVTTARRAAAVSTADVPTAAR
jgi:DEAD/DEAH box helicase